MFLNLKKKLKIHILEHLLTRTAYNNTYNTDRRI